VKQPDYIALIIYEKDAWCRHGIFFNLGLLIHLSNPAGNPMLGKKFLELRFLL